MGEPALVADAALRRLHTPQVNPSTAAINDATGTMMSSFAARGSRMIVFHGSADTTVHPSNADRILTGQEAWHGKALGSEHEAIGDLGRLVGTVDVPGLGIWGTTATVCNDNVADGFIGAGIECARRII